MRLLTKQTSTLLLCILSISGCNGRFDLEVSECAEGKARKGGMCVAEPAAATISDKAPKLSATDCIDPDLASVKAGSSKGLIESSAAASVAGLFRVSREIHLCRLL